MTDKPHGFSTEPSFVDIYRLINFNISKNNSNFAVHLREGELPSPICCYIIRCYSCEYLCIYGF